MINKDYNNNLFSPLGKIQRKTYIINLILLNLLAFITSSLISFDLGLICGFFSSNCDHILINIITLNTTIIIQGILQSFNVFKRLQDIKLNTKRNIIITFIVFVLTSNMLLVKYLFHADRNSPSFSIFILNILILIVFQIYLMTSKSSQESITTPSPCGK